MFHIGGLIVFCGLLAQTKALLEGLPLPLPLDPALPAVPSLPLNPALPLDRTLPSVPTELAGHLTSALTNGLISGDLLDILQNLPLLDVLKAGKDNSGGLVGGLLEKVTTLIPFLNNLVEVTVTDPQLLQLGFVQSPDSHRLYVTIPLGLVLNVKTTIVGSLLRLDVKLNITVELLVVKDEQGKAHLVVGDCTHSPGSLKISLLNRAVPFPIQQHIDSLTGILNNVLPELVQGKICPLVNDILKHLDVTLVHDIINLLSRDQELVVAV